MQIALVDDDPIMRRQLTDYVKRYSRENAIDLKPAAFPGGDALLAGYAPVYDIIIFDIDMPGINGLETARLVRAQDQNVVILFVTNIAQYAINGYEVEAVDYVLKPISYFDFALKLRRALRRTRQKMENRVVLDTTKGPVQVLISSIRYVEVMDHYIIYHLDKETYQVRGTFKEHESALRRYHFSRCHKSYMVNLAYISNIRASGVLLGNEIIPLGRTFKESLMEDYIRFLHG